MRIGLRPRILALTVLPPVALAVATVWIVHRAVTREAESAIHEELRRASLVFESTLEARSEGLAVAGQVIARDPRFFSILTLSVRPRDSRYRATVQGVAREFNQITRADVFEVVDARGRLLATAGRKNTTSSARAPLVRTALEGRAESSVLVDRGAVYQVAATPVLAHGRVVGALLLGGRIGEPLARRLRDLTRSEVTFVAGDRSIGTTLDEDDRDALLEVLKLEARSDSLGQGELSQFRAPSQTYLTLVRPLPEADPGKPLFYVMQRSLEAETAHLAPLRNGLVQLGLLAVLVAILAGMAVAQRITSPIERLVRASDEMERGDYQYPLEIRSRDEIGHLAERFEEMRRREKVYVQSLEEVARMKSEFINVASHELRTPISVIRGFHDLFAAGGLGPVTPAQTQALDAIETSLLSLTRLADDATKMAAIESERLVLAIDDYDIASVVRQAVSDAVTDARKRELDVEVVIEPDMPAARLDGPRIAQAITQLVRNSIRFTPDGGWVEVRVFREHRELVLQVRDTGVGIPEERRRKLFERSYMVHDSLHHHSSSTLEFSSSGLGLGLAIVRGIVEAHGGAVSVESEVARGTTITIRLPFESTPGLSAAA